MSNENNRTALITGASEGIGWELAKVMAADNWDLVLTARRGNLLENLSEDLQRTNNCKVTTIVKDLSVPENADSLFKEVKDKGIELDALINNAGFGRYEEFIQSDNDVLTAMVNLNIISLTRLTKLVLPGMLERKNGWIMNVGSIAGFMSLPIFGVYAATKAYVLYFTEALSAELKGSGVSATCLAPGPTKTGFGRVAGRRNPNYDEPGVMTPDRVAMLGYKGMIARKRLVVTGFLNKLTAFSPRFFPRKFLTNTALKVMMKRA